MASKIVFSECQAPSLPEAQLEDLTIRATTCALSHGLLYLSKPQTTALTSAIIAPLTLLPSPFPRRLFEKAQSLQRIYNILYARVALDEDFLDSVLDTCRGVGQVDDFVGRLWTGWNQLRDEGLVQPLQLVISRSDYLLHELPGATQEPLSLKQVEFNTISNSYAPLAEDIAKLHKYLCESTEYYNACPYLKDAYFPPNDAGTQVAEGLAAAHKAYNVEGSQILFVVEDGERNIFDQRWLEYELMQKYSIRVVRQSFDSLGRSATLDSNTLALRITLPYATSSSIEISTVYFRTGSNPKHYSASSQYSTRFLLERSKAIKCPSIAMQLAGTKKVQEVLTQPGVLERFLCDEKRWGKIVFDEEQLKDIRSTWVAMWGLDADDSSADAAAGREGWGMRKARESASSLVLKPQREGGGSNIFKEDIPAFLDKLPPVERQAWIAMELITPPQGTGNYLIRSSEDPSQVVVKTEVACELGIFGWALFEDGNMTEKEAGWLVRTKSRDCNEGGVHAGYAVFDSLVLVDE